MFGSRGFPWYWYGFWDPVGKCGPARFEGIANARDIYDKIRQARETPFP